MDLFAKEKFKSSRYILAIIGAFFLLQPNCLQAFQSEMEVENRNSIRPYFGNVAGRVFDPEGNPLSGATVVFHSRAYLYDTTIFPFPGWVLRNAGYQFKLKWEQSTTDDQGRFKFSDTKLIQMDSAVSVAHPDCASVSVFDIHDQMTIQMPEAMCVRGNVIADDGNPVPDVEVTIRGQFPFAELTGFVDHANVKTDVDGRFEIPFVKKAKSAQLRLRKAGFAYRKLDWFSESSELPAAAFGSRSIHSPDYVQGNFVYKLRQATIVRIKAIDPRTKEIVNLEGATNVRSVHWGIRSFEFSQTNSSYSVSNDGSVEFANINFGRNGFWTKPPESSGLLGAFFELDVKHGDKTHEKEIELTQGSVVRGRVIDEQSKLPVKDVAIGYYPKKLGDHEQGVFPPAFVRTNEAGEFLITVPGCVAELKMVGESPGYITLAADPPADLPDSIENRYVREINPQPDAELPPIEFRLQKSVRVTGTVYYKEGVPAAGIMFAATHLRSRNAMTSRVTGQTDSNGKFVIDSLFDDATLQYDQDPSNPRLEPTTNRIFFWDPKQNLSCHLEVTRHSIEKTGASLDVFLQPPNTFAKGRIVDRDSGEGVAGLRLKAVTLRPRLPITWQATTDSNGYYDLSCLVPNNTYRINSQSADYFVDMKEIEIGGQAGVQELTTLEAHCRVEPKTKPFDAVPDLTKLDDEDALIELIKYIEDQLKKLPKRRPGEGWSSSGERANFKTRLMGTITEPARQLIRRKQDPDFQCHVYLKVLEQFNDPEFGEPLPQADLVDEARMALIRNIDSGGVFESYLKTHWGSTSTFYEQSIMQYSQKKEIDAWACRGLMREYGTSLARSCSPKLTSDKSFEKKLDRVARYWSQAAGSLADVEVHGQTLKEFMLKQFLTIEANVKIGEDNDPERIQRILEMFEQIKRGPS